MTDESTLVSDESILFYLLLNNSVTVLHYADYRRLYERCCSVVYESDDIDKPSVDIMYRHGVFYR